MTAKVGVVLCVNAVLLLISSTVIRQSRIILRTIQANCHAECQSGDSDVTVIFQDVCRLSLLPPTGLVVAREGKIGPLQGSGAKAKAFQHSNALD